MELKPYADTETLSDGTLLIVPYGIETIHPFTSDISVSAFNRTLWN